MRACVCVCVCVCARACMCVLMCERVKESVHLRESASPCAGVWESAKVSVCE